MSSVDELKPLPCPHCGAEPVENAIEPHSHALVFDGMKMPDHAGSHVIECTCGAGMIDATREAVLARWNCRAAQPVAGWQDISTAPRDGCVLLAAEFDRPGDWRVKVGYRDDSPDSFHGWRIFGASWKPTHWMPLPPPPLADTKEPT